MARLGAGSAAESALPGGSAALRVRGTALVTDSAQAALVRRPRGFVREVGRWRQLVGGVCGGDFVSSPLGNFLSRAKKVSRLHKKVNLLLY